jgi:putative addiction module component (TIGR02574 family)
MSKAIVSDLLRLSKRERLQIAERLWLSVADEQSMRVPLHHRQIIDERLAAYESGKSIPIPHRRLMQRLRKR